MKSPVTVLPALLTFFVATSAFAQTPCHVEFDGNTFANNWSSSPFTICIKTKATSTMVVQAVQMFTGEKIGIGTVGIWSHDAAKDEPKQELARGSWLQVLQNQWQGANLKKPVILIKDQTFWVSWIPVANSQTSVQANGPTLPGRQTYKWSRTNSAPWNGPYNGFQWKFRLYCTRLHPSIQIVGNGCADGFGVVGHFDAPATPTVGNQNFSLLGTQLPPSSSSLVVIGLQKNFPSFDLTIAGGPGCFIHTDSVVMVPLTTTSGTASLSNGTLSLKAPIPNNPNLKGFFLRTQLWVKDANSKRPLKAIFTNGVGITIQ